MPKFHVTLARTVDPDAKSPTKPVSYVGANREHLSFRGTACDPNHAVELAFGRLAQVDGSCHGWGFDHVSFVYCEDEARDQERGWDQPIPEKGRRNQVVASGAATNEGVLRSMADAKPDPRFCNPVTAPSGPPGPSSPSAPSDPLTDFLCPCGCGKFMERSLVQRDIELASLLQSVLPLDLHIKLALEHRRLFPRST